MLQNGAEGLKAVRGQRYLYRWDNRLYFRRGVPEDVRSAFGGKAEILVSLRTSSIAEARHKLQSELDRFEKAVSTMFRTMRRPIRPEAKSGTHGAALF